MALQKQPWNKGLGTSSEVKKAKRASYYQRNKERILSRVKNYSISNRTKKLEYMRWYAIYKKYGLTKEQHLEMFSRQNGKCKICNRIKPLVVDHCHETGKVRGLLCDRCNLLMGYVDQVELLKSALEYKHESK